MYQKIPSPSFSPNSSSSSSNNGGGASPSTAQNTNPKPNPNSNVYPASFIQADTQSFKQVVQMLTGSPETAAAAAAIPKTPSKNPIPPISKPNKKPAFKLYERRSSSKNLKMISPLIPNSNPGFRIQPEVLSPSILNFPSLALSPVTPLSPDPFNRSPATTAGTNLGGSEEEKAIANKKFYLLPSPRNGGENFPKLLPLFPLISPRMEMEIEIKNEIGSD